MKKLFRSSMTVIGIAFVSATLAHSALAQGKGNGRGHGRGNGGFDRVFGESKSDKSNKKHYTSGRSNRFKGLSRKLGRSPESLAEWYESERRMNPRLTYGQFVAANMIAKNNRKGISAQTILDGLRDGDNIGQVLQRRGMDDGERDRVRRVIKSDIEDRDDWWRVIKRRF